MAALKIGVLALQGAFAKHISMLEKLGAKGVLIRKPAELKSCDALIIPGGESTTMMRQMEFIDFFDSFREFTRTKPVFGTCAGLILMSDKILSDKMQPFHLLDITIERNAFGRQVESFETEVDYHENGSEKSKPQKLPAVFIRAPRIKQIGKDVQILATFQGEPVLVQQGPHLGATFHPELTGNPTIHSHFLATAARGWSPA